MRRLGAWFPGLLSDFLEVVEEHPPAKAGGCSNARLGAPGGVPMVIWIATYRRCAVKYEDEIANLSSFQADQ